MSGSLRSQRQPDTMPSHAEVRDKLRKSLHAERAGYRNSVLAVQSVEGDVEVGPRKQRRSTGEAAVDSAPDDDTMDDGMARLRAQQYVNFRVVSELNARLYRAPVWARALHGAQFLVFACTTASAFLATQDLTTCAPPARTFARTPSPSATDTARLAAPSLEAGQSLSGTVLTPYTIQAADPCRYL